MGSASSTISIHFDGRQPLVAGQHVTGTVMFDNALDKSVKCQRIYAEFVGEVTYSIKNYTRGGYSYTTDDEPFFKQLINLEENPVRR
jgi:hypothetical protein